MGGGKGNERHTGSLNDRGGGPLSVSDNPDVTYDTL